MGKSIGLSIYLFARSRLAGLPGHLPALPTRAPDEPRHPPAPADRPRPNGPLIWFNAPTPTALAATGELIRRLHEDKAGISCLVTSPADLVADAARLPRGTLTRALPTDAPPMAQAFLGHWRPDLAVMLEGALPAALIEQGHAAGMPLFLVNGRMHPGHQGWFRRTFGMNSTLLQRFERILVQDAATARQFRRMGAPSWRMETAGRLDQGNRALPCTEAERDALAALLRSRPVWLAVSVPELEEAAVLAALNQALRLSHRLLLILVPENPARGPALAEAITRQGLNVSLRSRDEDPDQEDQVYIADVEGELGLWYRLAPVCYMGGTLVNGTRPRHPFEAAALGSAIMHGPVTGDWSEDYASLAANRAAQPVRNAAELGEAVGDLMAPDKAAQLAHDAWAVASSGAVVTDRALQLLRETLATLQAAATARTGAGGPDPAQPLPARKAV